jgi:hypothetical protein
VHGFGLRCEKPDEVEPATIAAEIFTKKNFFLVSTKSAQKAFENASPERKNNERFCGALFFTSPAAEIQLYNSLFPPSTPSSYASYIL